MARYHKLSGNVIVGSTEFSVELDVSDDETLIASAFVRTPKTGSMGTPFHVDTIYALFAMRDGQIIPLSQYIIDEVMEFGERDEPEYEREEAA